MLGEHAEGEVGQLLFGLLLAEPEITAQELPGEVVKRVVQADQHSGPLTGLVVSGHEFAEHVLQPRLEREPAPGKALADLG